MKSIIIVLFILVTFTSTIFRQDLEGEWYTPLRNKLLHVSITKDSINFRKCSFDKDLQDYSYTEMAFKIKKNVKSSYIVSTKVDSTEYYYLFYFEVKNGKNYMNLESTDKKFATIFEAENEIVNFRKQNMNITFLSKTELEKIRKKKNIEKMTPTDFKKFATKIIKVDSLFRESVDRKFKFTYLFTESTNRILLAKIGINSLVKGNVMDSMFEKFAKNPETKEIFTKMTKQK